jgi:ABC-type lipoprotein release transport system permease subunit
MIYFLSSSMMAGRIRDIGLVKALGSTDKNGFGCLMAAPLIITFFASVVSGLIGLLASTVVSVYLFKFSIASIITNNIIISIGITALSFLLSWVIIASRSEKALKLASVILLSGDSSAFDFKKEKIDFIPNIAERLSASFGFALKSIFRSKIRAKTAVICLFASILLITVSFVGTFVCWDTTRSYADKAFDQNTLVIGSANFVDIYQKMMQPITNINTQNQEIAEYEFTSSDIMVDQAFIEQLNTIKGVASVDKRLVIFTHVAEVQNTTIELDQFNDPHYVIYGDHRSADCIVVGVDPDQLIGRGFSQRFDTSSLGGLDKAIIGDSLRQIFQEPYKQNIRINTSNSSNSLNFNIANVVMDPLNHGYVTYLPISELQRLFSVDGFNLILVKVDSFDSEAISEIAMLATQHGFIVDNLDSAHNEYISGIDGLWFSVLPFTFFSVVIAMICLLNGMFVSISSRFHDFGIIRAIGAKPNYLLKAVFFECSIFVLAAAPIGIILGTIFDLLFLLPAGTFSLSFLFYSLIGIVVTLFVMCCLCALIVIHLRKRRPHELLQ